MDLFYRGVAAVKGLLEKLQVEREKDFRKAFIRRSEQHGLDYHAS